MDDFEINEEIIEDLYIKFDIQIDPSFDIDKLSQEYLETIAVVEREGINAMAYINR